MATVGIAKMLSWHVRLGNETLSGNIMLDGSGISDLIK
jgi:hypothetical protein